MKTITISNQKGGVGKTTTAIALAEILSENNKVLLVDCDGSSTTLTKILCSENKVEDIESIPTLTDLILLYTSNRSIEKIAKAAIINCKKYDLLAADTSLVTTTTSLSLQNNLDIRFKTLKNILSCYKDTYDYVIFDSAPVLDILSINQLVASDELVIVSQCQGASKKAINELLNSITDFVTPINKNLKISGILLTMLDKRTKYGKEQIEDIKKNYKVKVFDTVIPRAVVAEKYTTETVSSLSNVKNVIGKSYREFTKELLGEYK